MSVLIPFSEALGSWLRCFETVESEEIPVDLALGRILAGPAVADVDLPPFDTSAMDGWAVRCVDVVVGRGLPVAGTVLAGPGRPAPLPEGSTVKVMTGAPLPAGTEAIVPVEEARREGNQVVPEVVATAGRHIRRRGEVVRTGAELLPAGCALDPGRLALLAAASCGKLRVVRRPRVALVVTGDELVEPGEQVEEGQIRNSNGRFLAAAIEADGGEAVGDFRGGDEGSELRNLLAASLDRSPDLLVTSGGVSMGDRDLLPDVLRELGATVLFHRVAIKPAKPVLAARLGRVMVLALPGNPVSVSVGWQLFGQSAMDRMLARPARREIPARLASSVSNRSDRLQFLDVALSWEGGDLVASPLSSRGSHDLLTHSRCDGLLPVPPRGRLEAGETVAVRSRRGLGPAS